MDWKTRIVEECVKGVRIPLLFALLPAAFFIGRRFFELGEGLTLDPLTIVAMVLWSVFFTGLAAFNAVVFFTPSARETTSEWMLDYQSKRPLTEEEKDLLRLLVVNDGGTNFDSVHCSLPQAKRTQHLRVANTLEGIGLVRTQRLYLSVTLTERGMKRALALVVD